jgi:hypothetical protein
LSKLYYYQRPLVAFDPDNSDHRKWFAQFQKYRTWSKCPVRFLVDDEAGDLITLIQQRLIQWYVKNEFSEI